MGGRAEDPSGAPSSAGFGADIDTNAYLPSSRLAGDTTRRVGDAIRSGDPDSLLDSMLSADDAHQRRERAAATAALRDQATLAGLLLDLAETGLPIGVELSNGSAHIGVAEEISSTAAQLRTRGGSVVVFPLDAVIGISAGYLQRPPTGDRRVPEGSLLARLGELGESRPLVRIGRSPGATQVAGRLLGVAVDIVTVRTDDGRLQVIPLHAISEVVLP